jgi:hypothetical protein
MQVTEVVKKSNSDLDDGNINTTASCRMKNVYLVCGEWMERIEMNKA